MLGVLVNTATIIIGSLIGLLFKKGISKRFTDAIMLAIGLCTLYIGISGSLEGENTLILIIAIVFGVSIGTWIDIDGRMNNFGDWAGRRFKNSNSNGASFAEGFVTGSLLFCVGAMAVVGSLNAGLAGDNEMLYTKALLDLVAAAILTVSLGFGVLFASVAVFVYQGSIVLLAQLLAPVLEDYVIAEITCAGSVMIIALGLNLIGLTKIKVANFLPAIIIVPVVCWISLHV